MVRNDQKKDAPRILSKDNFYITRKKIQVMSEAVKELLNSLKASTKLSQVMSSRVTEIEGDKIIALDLSFCKISDIPDGVFANLNDLKRLYLGYNDISSVSTATFKGLEGLTLLSLFHCELGDLPDDIFSGLKTLDWLDLRENNLNKLPTSIAGLKKLEYLYLQNNVDLDFGNEFDFNQDYHSKKDVGKFFEGFGKYTGAVPAEKPTT